MARANSEILEEKTFLGLGVKYVNKKSAGCRTVRSCLATGGVGVFLLLLSAVVFIAGPQVLEEKILERMTLKQGSEMLSFWLNPPVQPQLAGYAFHVTNPEEVQRGGKPVLEEVGPFVYRAVIIKDSKNKETGKDNLEYNDDGDTLTYRPRYGDVRKYFHNPNPSVSDIFTSLT